MPPDVTPRLLMQPDARLRRARAELDRLWAPGVAFLGSRTAIMGGAMSWVSERTLVAAISNAGGFGVIAGGSMGPDALAAEIAATQQRTAAPFGVNLITMHPRLADLIRVCLEARVGHVVLAGGVAPGPAGGGGGGGGARGGWLGAGGGGKVFLVTGVEGAGHGGAGGEGRWRAAGLLRSGAGAGPAAGALRR